MFLKDTLDGMPIQRVQNRPVSCTISCPLCQKTLPIFPIFSFPASCCYWNAEIELSSFFSGLLSGCFVQHGFTIPPAMTGLYADKWIGGGQCIISNLVLWFPFLASDTILFHMHTVCLHLITVWQWLLWEKSQMFTLTFLLHWNASFLKIGKVFEDYAAVFSFPLNFALSDTCLTYVTKIYVRRLQRNKAAQVIINVDNKF